ncbi:MAG: thioredoxin domain-containing protein [Alphaproteobacteria bacterium]
MLLPAMLAAGLLLGGTPAAVAAELSKEQIEEIVHDYIVNHADVILKSVDDFQRSDMEKRQSDALKLNHEELFNNEKSPFIGNPDGDVTMIEFFDYNCHYCKQIFPELRSLAEKDKKLKIIFKDLPILGPTSESSARWALAAQIQGKYFPFHQKLMEHKGPFTDDDLEGIAKNIGLDMAKAKKDVEGTEVLLQIERNRSLAGHMNFNGTPSFVINEQAFSGVPNQEELTRKIEEARGKKGGDTSNDKADDKKDEKSGDKKEE